eukprot:2152562-Rhodomonas_salina.1
MYPGTTPATRGVTSDTTRGYPGTSTVISPPRVARRIPVSVTAQYPGYSGYACGTMKRVPAGYPGGNSYMVLLLLILLTVPVARKDTRTRYAPSSLRLAVPRYAGIAYPHPG